MPLATEETTVGDAIETVREYIDAIDGELSGDDLDTDTDYATALREQRGNLQYYLTGLVWVRDEADWGADANLVLGAPTAGEQALMDRERPQDAGRAERRLWFVAAGLQEAPCHHDDDVAETFAGLTSLHAGFVHWCESQLDALATPGNLQAGSPAQPSGRPETSPTSSTPAQTTPSTTQPGESTATTSSSSDSPTD